MIEEINFDDNFGENDNLDENDNRDNYLTRAYCVVTTFMPAESFVCPGLVTMYTGNANDDDEEDDVFSNDNTDNNDNNVNNDYDVMMTATSAAFIAFQTDTTLTDPMALCFSKQFEQHYAG